MIVLYQDCAWSASRSAHLARRIDRACETAAFDLGENIVLRLIDCPTARRHSRARRCCSRCRPASASPALAPEIRLATAPAQALASAFAADADFGMPPPMQASPMTWMLGTSFEANVTGSIGHQPVWSAAPAMVAMRPAFCGGMTLATCAIVVAEIGDQRVGRGFDRNRPCRPATAIPVRSCRDRVPSRHSRTGAAAERRPWRRG